MAGATLLTSSCNDWLDVLPKNEQVSPEYWKTKEQVEEVLAQGYQNMRLTVPTLIYWGELRGASIYAYSGKSKQEFFIRRMQMGRFLFYIECGELHN